MKRLLFWIETSYDNFLAKHRIKMMKSELADLQWELFVTKSVKSADVSDMVKRVEQLQKAIYLEETFIIK